MHVKLAYKTPVILQQDLVHESSLLSVTGDCMQKQLTILAPYGTFNNLRKQDKKTDSLATLLLILSFSLAKNMFCNITTKCRIPSFVPIKQIIHLTVHPFSKIV